MPKKKGMKPAKKKKKKRRLKRTGLTITKGY